MSKENRRTSRKSGRWWKWLLLLPLMDIKPTLPGPTDDYQLDEARRLREKLRGLEKPRRENQILSDQPGAGPRRKNLIRSVVEWIISPLKR